MDVTVTAYGVMIGLIIVGAGIGYIVGYLHGDYKGNAEGRHMSKFWYQHMRECDSAHKKERDLYREVAIELCDRVDDCMYCPFATNKCNERCKLWETERRRGLA